MSERQLTAAPAGPAETTPPATRQWPPMNKRMAPLVFTASTAAASNPPPSHLASSSVSSPSAHDADCSEVDELLEGIDRVRIDDLWITPRSAAPSPGTAPFREGLFAPPQGSGIAAITSAKPTGFRSKPLKDILDAAAKASGSGSGSGSGSENYSSHIVELNANTNKKPLTLRSKSIHHTLVGKKDSSRLEKPSYTRTLSAPHIRPSPVKARPAVESKDHAGCQHQHQHSYCVSSSGPPLALIPTNTGDSARHNHAQRSGTFVDPTNDFPALFKVYPCPTAAECYARGDHAECFYYHAMETDRRRPDTSRYRPHMCRFVEEVGGCRKGDRCPFAHNDFERRYHPDRFGKETCRDFLRGDCPRLYCTFRHEVSSKVEISLTQIDAMSDKEVLQLVLKISDVKGRALSEKLVRRFGHGKKHSGWRLEGFNPRGRDDQKVKFVTARVEEAKRQLKGAGERKWAASLKTSSLRDMMSGVRKVAEEIRERHFRTEESKQVAGPEMQRLIRAVFSNTNWSCHSQEGDNPFIVTPDNQNDAMDALERLINQAIGLGRTQRNINNNNNNAREWN